MEPDTEPKRQRGRKKVQQSRSSQGVIYALRDPQSGAIRYIGLTRSPKRREWMHGSPTNNRGARPVNCWIRKLLKSELKPVFQVIEEADDLEAREQHWIAHYRALGCALLNVADGGTSTDFLRRAPASHVARGSRDALHGTMLKLRVAAKYFAAKGDMAARAKMLGAIEAAERTLKRLTKEHGRETARRYFSERLELARG